MGSASRAGFASRMLRKTASRLSPPRRDALLRLAVAGRELVTGEVAGPRRVTERGSTGAGGRPYPSGFRISADPVPIPEEWPDPPAVKRTGPAPHGYDVYDLPRATASYDVELLEALNEEYAAKRVVERTRSYRSDALASLAQRRVRTVHEKLDLAGKRVLEIGCGSGYDTWLAANALGADAYGIDVVEREPWEVLRGQRVQYLCADMTVENPFPPNHFDRIMSFAAWEHIVHPTAALAEAFKVLKPGGLAWIRANLHRGPQASHLYRDIFFPWPHLLFTDEVIMAFYRRRGMPERGAAWVNRLTWMEYEERILRIGFQIEMLRFSVTPIDEDLYHRFADVLSRYPRWDLERDFFTVVLRKPA